MVAIDTPAGRMMIRIAFTYPTLHALMALSVGPGVIGGLYLSPRVSRALVKRGFASRIGRQLTITDAGISILKREES